MLGLAGIEPVAGQLVLTQNNMKAAQCSGHRDRSAHSAIGTGASPDGVESIAELDVDLVVMGLYGHSRLQEFVLGGVSRHMLSRLSVPLFISH